MPYAISWYTLGKTIGDPTTIDEEIDALILAHNLDASAHGQSDEAVYNHRISELLDHVNYSIYNIKLNANTRTIKAFVDVGGAAEFSSIQEAIVYVNALGGGRIFIKAGTYTLNANLTIYSNIQFEGEDDELVIIDFDNSYRILTQGTSGTHKLNVSFKNIGFQNSNNDESGAFYFQYCDDVIFDDCKYYNIVFSTAAHVGYVIQTSYVSSIEFQRCKFSSVDRILHSNNTDKLVFENNKLKDINKIGIYMSSVTALDICNNVIDNNDDYLVQLEAGAGYVTINKNKFINVNQGMFYLNGVGSGAVTDNIGLSLAGSNHGIFINGSADTNIKGNQIYAPGGDGIRITSSDRNIITNNNVQDGGGYGVNITDAASDWNIVDDNVLMGNSSGQLNDLGTNTGIGVNSMG